MMRVAYVCADRGIPIFGHKGASIHVREICRAFLDAGCDLTLFASRRGGEIPSAFRGVPLVDLPAPSAADPLQRECDAVTANEAIGEALAAAGGFDVVYERAALWSVAPMTYAARTGAVSIVELNAPLVDEQARYRTLVQADLARGLLASTLRSADVVVAVSDAVATWARGLAPAANVHVVPNGVDLRRFAPAERRSDPAGSEFVIGFVGTLRPWHGLPVLIDAFAAIAADIPHARLKIVGDGPERSLIVAQAERHGLLERMTMTGPVPHDDVPALLRTMDVAVAPYPQLENFYFSPLKLVEYMAAGLPVVASDAGDVSSLVRHGETGVLVAPGDARDLAGALRRLYDDPGLRDRLGSAARDFVAARCTWTRVLERTLSLAGFPSPDRADGAGALPAAVSVTAGGKGRGSRL